LAARQLLGYVAFLANPFLDGTQKCQDIRGPKNTLAIVSGIFWTIFFRKIPIREIIKLHFQGYKRLIFSHV